MATLQEVHGDGNCYICGKPMIGAGEIHCSYPHGMVPDKVIAGDPDGFWTWKLPDDPAVTNGE